MPHCAAGQGSDGRRTARPSAHVGSAELTSLRPGAFATARCSVRACAQAGRGVAGWRGRRGGGARVRAAWQWRAARRCSEHAVHVRGLARRGVQWQARVLAGVRAWRRHGSAVVRVRAAASRPGVASPRLRVHEHGLEWSGAVRCAARAVVQGEREAGCGSGASGGGSRPGGARGERERGRGGRKEGGRERKEKGGAVRQRRLRPRSATRGVATRVRATGDGHAARREGRKKERGKKEGARFAAVGRDASLWVGNGWDVH